MFHRSLLNPSVAPCDGATNTASLSKSDFWNKCTREVGVYIEFTAGRAAAAAAKNGVEAVSVYNMATRALSPTAPPPSYQPSKLIGEAE